MIEDGRTMRAVVSFTLRQKVVMNLLFVLLMVVGAFVLLRMPVERYPNIQFGKMFVITYLPGAAPEDIELLITKKIEEALDEVEDIEYVRSSSYRERSSVVIKFVDDCDYERRFDDVRLKVLSILNDLPENTEPPLFNFLDVNDWFPTVSVNVSGEHSNTSLNLVAEELKIVLKQVAGVKEVAIAGDFTREFHLLLSPAKLDAHGVTFSDVATAIRQANISLPAGHSRTSVGEFVVKVDEQFQNRDQLLNCIVRLDGDGSPVRIADVAADGYFSYRDPFIMTSVNGRDCVTLKVIKSGAGNAMTIARDVRNIVSDLRKVYGRQGMELTVTQDSSLRIEDSVKVLGVNLCVGIILVCAIIWGFMGFRNAALTTIGIPFAFLVTIILMYFTGTSINEVSLFAFVLVSGIIVDDAIVVVENIFRHLEGGASVRTAVVDGCAEVFLPVVSATLTTIVAFLPMLIMTGMVGDFFALVPQTITYALLASLFECLLILPCHYVEFGPRPAAARKVRGDHETVRDVDGWLPHLGDEVFLMRWTRRGFHWCILLALRFRWLSLLVLGAAFLTGMSLFFLAMQGKSNLVRIRFFPDNYSLFYAEVFGPPGTPITATHELVKKLSTALVAEGPGQVESALGYAGYYINEDFSPQYGNNVGFVAVTLPVNEARVFADFPVNDVIVHLDAVRDQLQSLMSAGFTLSVRPEKDGPPSGKDINIRILGKSGPNVALLAREITRFLRQDAEIAPSLVDLLDDQGAEARTFRIRLDHDRIAERGLALADIASVAAAAVDGGLVGEMKLADETVDIRLKVAADNDAPLVGFLDLPVVHLPDGVVRLGDVSRAEFGVEPGYLNRFQSQHAITLTANIKGGAPLTSARVVARVQAFYNSIRADFPGATLNFAGEYESTQKSFLSLAYAFVIALVIIYVILAAQFQSYLQPLIIISAVVFALTGVIYGAIFSRTIFTVNSFVAVVGVTGVVVNDSLVLVEFINKCYLRGMNRKEALLLATHIRLRPILLTTLTTTLGLLPMAIGVPQYSLIWGSMAMTFVTGLCTATFLTIIFVPVQWDLLTKMKENFSWN